jgi:hypothetical protein
MVAKFELTVIIGKTPIHLSLEVIWYYQAFFNLLDDDKD